MLRVVIFSALIAAAASMTDDDGWLNPQYRRNLIVEVGAAAYSHQTVACDPKAVGSVAACFSQSIPAVGNVDFPWGSPQIAYPTDGSPWGVHLTGPYPDGRTYLLSWYTGAATVGANLTKPNTSALKTVAVLTKGGTSYRFSGSVITYLRTYSDPALANYQYLSPYIHHVLLTGLTPRTTYRYQLAGRDGRLAGGYSFTTLPLTTNVYPLRIGLIADVGQTVNSSATRDHLAANRPQVVLHVGDNSYSDNYNAGNPNLTDGKGTNQNRWDSHAQLWQSLFSAVPVLNCAGNHELEMSGISAFINSTTSSFSFPSNYPFQSYAARFPAPGTPAASLGAITPALYYSTVIAGAVTLITLNNYIPFQPGSPQHSWALAEFAKVDRAKTPWLFVQFHAPPYHTYFVHYKEMECFMSVWEDVFYNYGVDLVLSGHVHAYERTHPLYKYRPDSCGPVYLTIGDGGNVEGPYRNFVDELNPATNKTYCESLNYGGVGPVAMSSSAPTAWGPAYQRMSHPPGCPTLSFQPPSGVAGGLPLLLLNNTSASSNTSSATSTPNTPPLGFCQSSQPVWSAYRDPSFGHAILDLLSPSTARFRWFKNLEGNAVARDDVVLERLDSCTNRGGPQAGSGSSSISGGRRARMMA
ncbi:hypothetical protein Agub_g16045 [Astrephomene gubernaculifera]|uniref:Purple acid phosphatase n=1 Tax=Astrephomene gubernaculifera TaxID=47775 RepID=A0AAD3E4E8_9CHLO|nr:hypothetical protein Agub_g16045 [Astrephomene gubernaculifera]